MSAGAGERRKCSESEYSTILLLRYDPGLAALPEANEVLGAAGPEPETPSAPEPRCSDGGRESGRRPEPAAESARRFGTRSSSSDSWPPPLPVVMERVSGIELPLQ